MTSSWAGILSAFVSTLLLATIAFIIQFQGSEINITVGRPSEIQKLPRDSIN